MAQSLLIGLVIDCVGSYGRRVLHGIMAYAKAHPRWAIMLTTHHRFEEEADIDDWQVDGLIVQAFSREFEQRILQRGIPASNVSNIVPKQLLPTVVPDDVAVARLAARDLLERGFRQFGFYGPTGAEYSELRRDNFKAALGEAGHEPRICANVDDPASWLAELPRPIAILAGNDDWAHRLLNACRRIGAAVPDEVAVLGVDDDELFNTIVTPSLSSVALPTERVGYEAAALLDRLLGGGEAPPAPIRLPPLGIVTRQSTDVLAIEDAEVVAAVRYIRDHAGAPVQVQDVLDAVAVSRRSLERRFRARLGRSVLTEIGRAHVERAKQLLAATDLPLRRVASASGFASATRLGIVFRKLTGQPPSRYRRAQRLPDGDALAAVVADPPGRRRGARKP